MNIFYPRINYKVVTIITLLIINFSSFSQNVRKYYYDSTWKGCEENVASFYRVVNINSEGKPIGKVFDYFMTGEIQGIADSAAYIDQNDDINSIYIGKVETFYENGKRKFENINNSVGKTIHSKKFYENGIIEYEYFYNDKGNLDGICKYYYRSGKLSHEYVYSDGELENNSFIEYDELGFSRKKFIEDFYTDENKNNWDLIVNSNDGKSQIIPKNGLMMESFTGRGFKQSVYIPIMIDENFSIETNVKFISGEKEGGYGLIWGFKDIKNYSYFVIDNINRFKIGVVIDGIMIEKVGWTTSNQINRDFKNNWLKVSKLNNSIFYAINGNLVFSSDYSLMVGNEIGFCILSGKKKVLFEKLEVSIEINSDDLEHKNSEEWKGNGSGFFISKDGYVATNYHVISDANEIELEFIENDKKVNYQAEIVKTDAKSDLAILKIKDKNFIPFKKLPYFFSTGISDVGTNVFSLGYPMALTIMGTDIKFTDGRISAKTGYQGNIETYQTTTPLQPGNSGGPLFDFNGNLIGINSAIIRPDKADNVSYSIKSIYLKNLMDILPFRMTLPNDKSLSNLTLTEKIKVLSNYVVLIKIK